MASRIKGITVEIGGDTTGLEKALKNVNSTIKSTQSEAAAAAETLVGKNAMSGFLAVMQAAPGDIEKLNSAIANCDGTAEDMAATMQDNLTGQLTILKSQLEELAISFGDMLMPVIRKVVTAVQGFVDKLNNMDEGTRETILQVGLFVAALGPVLLIIGKLSTGIGKGLKAFVSLSNGLAKHQELLCQLPSLIAEHKTAAFQHFRLVLSESSVRTAYQHQLV